MCGIRLVFRIDFPNNEVRSGFVKLTANSFFGKLEDRPDNWVKKLDGSAREALEQIETQQYGLPYLSDKRKLHKIGVNISSESRTVEEWIVEE